MTARFAIMIIIVALGILSCSPKKTGNSDTGKTISSVDIRYVGWQTVAESRLRGFMKTEAGDLYSATRLDDDIRSLYESGMVDDIRFLISPDGEQVRIVAEVKTRMPFGPSAFQGNRRFSNRKLASVTKLRTGQTATTKNLLAACRRLEIFYHRRNFPQAKVSYKANRVGGTKHTSYVFLIDEGARS